MTQLHDLNPLAASYVYWRRKRGNRTASQALELAKADVASGTARYTGARWDSNYGVGGAWSSHNDSCRWYENPEACGFRFVGWADELGACDHTGWYDSPEGDRETYRGAVYQLPSRGNKRALFVAGYRHGSVNQKRHWVDACGSDTYPAVIEFRTLADAYEGDGLDSSYHKDSGAVDAARRADRLAEIVAETEREYQEAWSLGALYADLDQQAKDERKHALALAKEFRLANRELAKHPLTLEATCKHLRDSIVSGFAAVRELRKERDKIIADSYFSEDTESAFLEGAGLHAMPSN